ncbi:Transcriptional coactivator Hfi1/Transcriptional adapter 1 [Corchorus olitorius]|uniref:Transcriptional coactivator Hfi1/Transcriptional adapter 1 n=1 Tax=Corchorus olitorius TaxID=93759 RepID=A0A1R3K438_9ROSI|nr:Transcriptional coactivator Hfi1/Transcriptional adapter 1 [Corchorus olitorius]
MVARSSETEMPGAKHFSRVDTLELKSQIERKIGRLKAEKYFNLLARFLSLKIGKPEFDRLCIGTIGRENIRLHNHLLRSIIRNATFSKTPPSRDNRLEGSLSIKVANGYQKGSLQSLCKDIPQSPRRGRTPNLRDRKFKDRPSPLGPHGKSHSTAYEDAVPKVQEQQSATELFSLGSRPPGSVEDGEEVDQAAGSPSIHSRSPVRAPLGISLNAKGMRKVPWSELESASETCHCRGELPDSSSLRKRLEQKLAREGVNISVDCANLLNNSLDVFMKRLIKPCLELASSRSGQNINKGHNWSMASLNGIRPMRYPQKQSGSVSASMLDFRVAMELNPQILGAEWPTQLEKVCLLASEE